MTQPAPLQPQSRIIGQLRTALTAEQAGKALSDIYRGLLSWPLWGTMGWHDLRQRYRRSILGPFWITLSMGVMVTALGLLYGSIFRIDLHDYLPFLACGFVTWGLLSGVILEGTSSFIASENLMRQLPAPVSLYVYRTIWTNFLTFAHNIWIYIAVALWFHVFPGWGIVWVLPGLLLIAINGLWVGLLLGLLSARFRDIPLIVSNLIQVMFFITPVIWKPDMLPGRALLLELNPFYHFIEILRAPLLGYAPALENWAAALAVTAVGWGVTLVVYTAYRWRVPYWV